MHSERICYSCDPVILHGDVWMITMPYSHMPLSFDDLFSESDVLLMMFHYDIKNLIICARILEI